MRWVRRSLLPPRSAWRGHCSRRGLTSAAAAPLPLRSPLPSPPPAPSSPLRVPGVFVVRTAAEAAEAVRTLRSLGPGAIHAWDTEVVNLDLKRDSVVTNGNCISISCYAGPDVNFGGHGPRLWVDCLGGEGLGILDGFREYFEDDACAKVFHNYSFDSHVLARCGIRTRGLVGDTMHMARLWDSSLAADEFLGGATGAEPGSDHDEQQNLKRGYSLAALSHRLLGSDSHKETMKSLFAKPKLKLDGTEGKALVLPPLDEIQSDPSTVEKWVGYCTLDSKATWEIFHYLRSRLVEMPLESQIPSWQGPTEQSCSNMWHLYEGCMLPFGELLVEIERRGIRINVDYLLEKQQVAVGERDAAAAEVRRLAVELGLVSEDDAPALLLSSSKQVGHLLFGSRHEFIDITTDSPDAGKVIGVTVTKAGKERVKKAPKKRVVQIKGLGIPIDLATKSTPTGRPSIASGVLNGIAEQDPAALMQPDEHTAAGSLALVRNLLDWRAISTLMSTFFSSLLESVDGQPADEKRVHASLNLNTVTGRLSCKRPNLQNQPALEKDRYQIRRAFVPAEGKKLIVADYGQLELRLLAHMASDRNMLSAFEAGGDFHSRTAMSMYDYVAAAVDRGDVSLEGLVEGVPMLKDEFASERRKAKVLNFSIAYGKTEHGLAVDFDVSREEARETLRAWYDSRPDVERWQQDTIERARKVGYVTTLFGRRRNLQPIQMTGARNRRRVSAAERAAINTPIQGAAADVVMAAMIALEEDPVMLDLGFFQVLQIHDEVILEGPAHNADKALARMQEVMCRPSEDLGEAFDATGIQLEVSAKICDTWYEGK